MKSCQRCQATEKIEKAFNAYKKRKLQGDTQDGPIITSKQNIAIKLQENILCSCKKQ